MKSLSTVARRAGKVLRITLTHYLIVILQAVDDHELAQAVSLRASAPSLINDKPLIS
jgi:hypothetical protein